MPDPKDCLCFALDVSEPGEARRLVETLTPWVGLFKVGLELFVREGPAFLSSIRAWGAERIFLDLKFHDIPRTVRRARRSAGRLPVDFLSVHCESLLDREEEAETAEEESLPALLGITLLTSLSEADLRRLGYKDQLSVTDVVLARSEIARKAGCAGVVCSGREVKAVRRRFGPGFLIVTPGVRPAWSVVSRDDQARILTPYEAIRAGSDFVVVGRPIAQAPDPLQAAQRVVAEIREALHDRDR